MTAEIAPSRARTTVILALAALVGTAAGLGVALAERRATAQGARDALAAADVVAVVGTVAIGRDELERALTAVAADRRTPLTFADRARVLERLIDEELLVQAALEAGLPEHDRAVRRALTDAVMAAIEAQADDDSVQAAVQEYLAWLRAETRVWVR